MTDFKNHRKRFATICAVIGGAIVLVSLTFTYSVFVDCFKDWPLAAQRFFALACCAAIEGTSVAMIYGLVYALSGAMERIVAFIGLVGVGLVMALNIITHSQTVRGLPIAPWQQEYVSWVGPGVLIGVFALVVGLVICRFETKLMKLARDVDYAEQERELTAKLERLETNRPKAMSRTA